MTVLSVYRQSLITLLRDMSFQQQTEHFKTLLDAQLACLTKDVSKIAAHEEQLVIQRVPAQSLVMLCERIRYCFSNEDTVLDLASPIVAVGDLHGHFLDLLRILQLCGLPGDDPNLRYLILGDIVDRGEFSLETITLLYLLKAVYPSQIYFIRGNHEFDSLCSKYGFCAEILNEYPGDNRVYPAFLASFAQMPLGAVIDGVTVCLHGGIGPLVKSLDVIRSIKKPLDSFGSPLVASILWSDPNEKVVDYRTSPRGTGYLFGQNALLDFLETSQAVRIIRGHECVAEGYATMFDDRVVTIFSASNYCGVSENEAAVLVMDPEGEDELKRLPPLPYYRRRFAKVEIDERERIRGISMSGSLSAGTIFWHDGEEKPRPTPGPRPFQMSAVTGARPLQGQKRDGVSKATSLATEKWLEVNPIAAGRMKKQTSILGERGGRRMYPPLPPS